MDLNALEIAILRYLKPKLGRSLTPLDIYNQINSVIPCTKEGFMMTLNILIKEGYIDGYVSMTWDNSTVSGIDRDGLRWLRKQYGA